MISLSKCVNSLLKKIYATFDNYYKSAKEDMMIGQIDSF